MKALKDIRNVYFIGIGGIGMSALARYFHSKGVHVSGYDRTPTPLTAALDKEGIAVHFDDEVSQADSSADWVVYTPAIPATNTIMRFYREGGYTLLKRSDVLEQITAHSFNICIAGTHGKTTITTMTAHILRHSGYGCNAFLGGISVNYHTNFWSSEQNVCVVEADEYDRSFLKLSPDVAVITAMDPDHLDIYGTAEAMEDAFIAFAGRLKAGGWLLGKYGLPRGRELANVVSRHAGHGTSSTPKGAGGGGYATYHLHDARADVHTIGLRASDGSYTFDVMLPGTVIKDITLHTGGLHNVENTLAAVAVAHSIGIEPGAIREAVAAFQGVKRRFEYIVRTPDLVLVDDYAHHPAELRALISGAKDLFPERACTVVFQPHLFSRTKDLAAEFAASLDLADEVILLPIYPARELPVPGVTSGMILERMQNPRKQMLSKEDLFSWAQAQESKAEGKPRLVLMAGAGDIDALVKPVAEKLQMK